MRADHQRDNAAYRLAVLVALAFAIALRIWAFNLWDIHHSDEFTQYLEQGHRLAEGYGLIPWENRYGIRNALIAQFLALWIALGDLIAPQGMLPLVLARAGYAALCASALWGAWGIGRAQSRLHGLVALWAAGIWYLAVLYQVSLLSEAAASGLILCGAALLLREDRGARHLALAGLLLGLGVLVRLQYAVFVAVLALPMLRRDWRAWRWLIAGGLSALALGAASDLADHRLPFQWIIANFEMNLGAGRAARFGASGPLEYLRLMAIDLGPFAALMALSLLALPRRYWPLVAATFANVLVHSLIAHKEDRFVWLSTYLIVILSALAVLELAGRWRARRGREPVTLAAALAVCIGWTANSALAEHRSGGVNAFRGGGTITREVYSAGRDPAICGVIVPEQWQRHAVSAFARRDLPIYLAPAPVLNRGAALPPDLALAANALILDRALPGMGNYREIECRQRGTLRACLFVRPGACDPAKGAAWTAQAALGKDDL